MSPSILISESRMMILLSNSGRMKGDERGQMSFANSKALFKCPRTCHLEDVSHHISRVSVCWHFKQMRTLAGYCRRLSLLLQIIPFYSTHPVTIAFFLSTSFFPILYPLLILQALHDQYHLHHLNNLRVLEKTLCSSYPSRS